jgi:hypothetical protein
LVFFYFMPFQTITKRIELCFIFFVFAKIMHITHKAHQQKVQGIFYFFTLQAVKPCAGEPKLDFACVVHKCRLHNESVWHARNEKVLKFIIEYHLRT